MNSFQIIDSNTVKTERRGSEYTVQRTADGFRVFCVNASSRAYNKGYATPRNFKTLGEVESAYKGLSGVTHAFT